jgi:hypothetical protein
MTKARAQFALSAVVSAFALSAFAPAPATALISHYDCYLKPSNQWCDGRANGTYDGQNSWDFNQGWYPGAWDGTVTACQHVWKPSTGGVLTGSSCAVNFTQNDYGNVVCSCYDAEVLQISGGAHSVNGFADSAH